MSTRPATPLDPDDDASPNLLAPSAGLPRPNLTGVLEEVDRLRRENRRMAVSLGAFSAFIASRGLLEEAWAYVNEVHRLDEE